eukprot:2303688-Pyramimonas_sp.AAC.1
MLLPSDQTLRWRAVASHEERHQRARAVVLDHSVLDDDDDLPETAVHQVVNRSDAEWMLLWSFEEELAAEE